MKYKNENGEWVDVSVKASDTLPIGTIVDYDGDTVPSGWEYEDDPNNYSLGEHKVGTWYNGKSIYRKVVRYTGTPTFSSDAWYFELDISDIDEICNWSVFCRDNSASSAVYKLPHVSYNYLEYQIMCTFYFPSKFKIERSSVYGNRLKNFIAIIEYTKTTDEGIVG